MSSRQSPPRSLPQRIMLSFALLVTFVAALYTVAVSQSIEFTERELITTVEYRFRVARHRGPQISAYVVPNDAKIFCQSNVARTDCIVRILYDNLAEARNTVIYLNGLAWSYAPVLTGDIVLDGVTKTFTVDGKNATSKIVWEDFPFLVPGENKISVSVNGVVVSHKSAEIIYTPTFL